MSGEATPAPRLPALPAAPLPAADPATRWTSALGAAADEAALALGRWVIDATVMPRPEALADLSASAEPLVDPALLREPGRFFDFAGAPPEPATPRTERAWNLGSGRARRRVFPTDAYVPWAAPDEAAREDPLRVDHWSHAGGGRGTVVALHGFLMGQPWLGARALQARTWWSLGLDVALPVLPHHGSRSDSWVSGERFAVPHVARLGEAVRRAVWELRMLLTWLRRESDTPVGVLGLSLGGYLAALLAGLYEDLDLTVAIQAPVCIGDLAWRFLERSRHYRGRRPPGLTPEALRTAYRVHSPLAHPVRLPRERLLVVARRGDRVVPPAHPHALWLHWGRPDIRWLAGGHLAPFGRAAIARAVTDKLRALAIATPT